MSGSTGSSGEVRPRAWRASRRGVLLLVVLSLLTLFMLLGMTFLILASRARTTSGAFLRLSQEQVNASDAYTPFLREAARQVMRGTTRPTSVLRSHDLLADRYGASGASEFKVANGQSIKVEGRTQATAVPSLVAGDRVLRMQLLTVTGSATPPRNWAGQVLTFQGGPEGVANTSVRVLTSFDARNDDSDIVYVERPAALTTGSQVGGVLVWINPREFSGPGLTDTLTPNRPLTSTGASGGDTNTHEDYDFPDAQNMALHGGPMRPSFHRPELFDRVFSDWTLSGSTVLTGSTVLAVISSDTAGLDSLPKQNAALAFRRASLTPYPYDHSPDGSVDFAGRSLAPRGTATTLDILKRPIPDVDADGDGVLDSIWVDLGQPPLTTSDRVLVKPLFAIKCVDLGGRLNVNAHGSPAHLRPAPSSAALAADGPDPPSLRRGLGYGPADVRLDLALGDAAFRTVALGADSLYGKGYGIRRDLGPTLGRYGQAPASENDIRSGQGDGLVGLANRMRKADPAVPARWLDGAKRTRFGGGPPDLWSRTMLGIDLRGHPLLLDTLPAVADTPDTPYALDLTRPKLAVTGAGQTSAAAWVDQPFAPAELEGMLRMFDADNATILPQRLVTLTLASSTTGLSLDAACTSESWDTPAVIGGPPFGLLNAAGTRRGDFDFDLARGLRMDLNRPLGSGTDSDTDGLVDEPDEPVFPKATARYIDADGEVSGWWLTRGPLPPGLPPQPGPESAGLRARQLYAYHLFNLLGQLKSASQVVLSSTSGTTTESLSLPILASGTWTTTVVSGSAQKPPQVRFEPRQRGATLAETKRDIEDRGDRVLAQWAVNVVDFMDADSIMTPFRYSTGNPQAVVWGCEAPELLITETLALHDLGIADSDRDNGKNGRLAADDTPAGEVDRFDLTWDQIRLPRGSLFVELHNVRDPNAPYVPAELYDGRSLDLGRIPPGGSEPVWRLALTPMNGESWGPSPGNPLELVRKLDNDVFQKLASDPDGEWLSPPIFTGTSTVPQPSFGRRRFVWFTSTQQPPPPKPDTDANDRNTFRFLENAGEQSARLEAGQFLVVGPRKSTPVGGVAATPGDESPQKIRLSGSSVVATDFDGGVNPTLQRPDGSAIGDNLPPASGRRETKACWVGIWRWTPDAGFIAGLNVSERDVGTSDYYPQPSGPLASNPAGLYDPPLDNPFTDKPSNVAQDSLDRPGTRCNAATVFLERLADPTRPHDPFSDSPAWNPYVIVDFMPIDVTVFNGEGQPGVPERWWRPVRGGRFLPGSRTVRKTHFHTRQRGLVTDESGRPRIVTQTGSAAVFSLNSVLFSGSAAICRNPWFPGYAADVDHPPGPEQTTAAAGGGGTQFPYLLGRVDAGDVPADTCAIHTLGWTNISFGRRLGEPDKVPLAYHGSPSTPWPWITWNDRPFANPYELLLVPKSAPGRLLVDYRNPARDPLQPALPGGAAYDAYGVAERAGHLLPFTALNDPSLECRNADVLSDLFRFVRVASRFAGTARLLPEFTPPRDPQNTGDASAPMSRFLPPFNGLSTYREPGLVNLNAVPAGSAGDRIWAALAGGTTAPPQPPAWSAVELLRPLRTVSGAAAGSTRKATLLSGTTVNSGTGGSLFFGPQSGDDSPEYRYARRNAWFAFEPLIRTAALTTPRSDVYAIWVTMGFFEVTSADKRILGQSLYPDGYKLLREYGSQSGDVRRHRGFYIYDRSIPVGYRPGADANVDAGILVERLVE